MSQRLPVHIVSNSCVTLLQAGWSLLYTWPFLCQQQTLELHESLPQATLGRARLKLGYSGGQGSPVPYEAGATKAPASLHTAVCLVRGRTPLSVDFKKHTDRKTDWPVMRATRSVSQY